MKLDVLTLPFDQYQRYNGSITFLTERLRVTDPATIPPGTEARDAWFKGWKRDMTDSVSGRTAAGADAVSNTYRNDYCGSA